MLDNKAYLLAHLNTKPASLAYFSGAESKGTGLNLDDATSLATHVAWARAERKGSDKQAGLLIRLHTGAHTLGVHGGTESIRAAVALFSWEWANAEIKKLSRVWSPDTNLASSNQMKFLADLERRHYGASRDDHGAMTQAAADKEIKAVKALIAEAADPLLREVDHAAAVSSVAADFGNVTDIFSRRTA